MSNAPATWEEFYIAHFDQQGHQAEVTFLKCIDWRYFDVGLGALTHGLGVRTYDIIARPSPVKTLAYSGDDADALKRQNHLVADIELSIKLHETKRIVLFAHWDCGAYGGSKSFADQAAEEATYQADLGTAGKFLQQQFPSMAITLVYSKRLPNQRLVYNKLDLQA
jgi:hypothetical protein